MIWWKVSRFDGYSSRYYLIRAENYDYAMTMVGLVPPGHIVTIERGLL